PTPAEASAVSAALQQAVAAGAQLVLLAGGVSTDPVDALFAGLRAAGGQVTRVGVPVDPGTACWTGRLGALPVLGLASCDLFGRDTAVDRSLPRLLIGEPLDTARLRRLAHGGLLGGGPPRVPDYKTADGDRGKVQSARDEAPGH